jgi:hypothetical protein
VLPLVIDEKKLLIFKFWFEDHIQEGMSYKGELFCRLQTFPVTLRPQVYQFSCRLLRQGTLVALTSGSETCSVWVSLRDPQVKALVAEAEAGELCHILLPTSLNSTQFE